MRRATPAIACVVAVAGLLLVVAPHLDLGAAARWVPPAGTHQQLTLEVRTLGEGQPPIVLLHGILGSNLYWGAAFDQLAGSHRLIAPDLLGYGDSPKPPRGYTPDDHAEALAATLEELGVREPVVLVAHSLGSLVALRLAAQRPDLVRRIIAFGPPLYRNPEEARARIKHSDPMAGVLVFDTALASKVCIWFHTHPWLSARLAKLMRLELPFPVAEDATRHTWKSYWQTMEHVILPAQAAGWLHSISQPVHLVLGGQDAVADAAYLQALARQHPHVTFEQIEGSGHDLPLTHPDIALAIIRKALAESEDSDRVNSSKAPDGYRL